MIVLIVPFVLKTKFVTHMEQFLHPPHRDIMAITQRGPLALQFNVKTRYGMLRKGLQVRATAIMTQIRDTLTRIIVHATFNGYSKRDGNQMMRIEYLEMRLFQPEMIVYHDSEDSLRLYIKRNYRNARAYIRVFSTRQREHSLNDDFFPWYVQFQPFFTLAFWLSSLAGFIYPWIWLGSAIIFIFINLTFLNITRQVFETQGRSLKTLFLSNSLLFLRNTVWIGGFFAGLKNVILDRKNGGNPK